MASRVRKRRQASTAAELDDEVVSGYHAAAINDIMQEEEASPAQTTPTLKKFEQDTMDLDFKLNEETDEDNGPGAAGQANGMFGKLQV